MSFVVFSGRDTRPRSPDVVYVQVHGMTIALSNKSALRMGLRLVATVIRHFVSRG